MNYQLELEKILEKEKNNKPKLLLHVCCSPCSTYVLEYLHKYFDITIYYYNPNIDTNSEYVKRYNEIEKLIERYPFSNIDLVKTIYNHEEFLEIAKSLDKEKEGGTRCTKCYRLRLDSAFKYALKEGFDYITTTLTISPYKSSSIINNIGKELEDKYKVKYLYSDFKKKDGYKRSIELSKKYNLYRQDYCGCEYSLKEMSEKYENKKD